MSDFIISKASDTDLTDVAALFRAYAAALPIDLDAQRFIEEVGNLPGAYGPPRGALLLARAPDRTPLGCIALRPLDPSACEMKRLYVTPAARGLGLGRALIEALSVEATALGYLQMKLDTLSNMTEAIGLYRRLGFEPIPPYGSHPYPDLICLGKALRQMKWRAE
jgi:ribosomal protein S18 acetylase RimI-like enzyme